MKSFHKLASRKREKDNLEEIKLNAQIIQKNYLRFECSLLRKLKLKQ